MSLEALNPNQFAFEGLEHMAHPLARHVAAGINFQMKHFVRHTDTDRPGWENSYRTPMSFDPPVLEHDFEAKRGASQNMADLNWAGSDSKRTPSGAGHFPGEIGWVGRHPASGNEAPKGLLTDMWKAGHEIDMGQSTVPVHSPDRTPAGERWSAQTGKSRLRPKLGDFDWTPPAGIHPYERAGSPAQLAPAMEGQMSLRGVAGHVLKEQRTVNARRALAGKLGEGRPAGRAVAVATFHNGVRVR